MKMKIRIYEEKGGFVAEAIGGWFLGHGSTRSSAIKSLIKRYERETGFTVELIKEIPQPESIQQPKLF